MKRREFLSIMAGSAAGLAAHAVQAQPVAPPPNILFILADDLGWADLGCYGSTYHESPRLDRLAQEGMRFTDAYAAAPVCSPTRASILTGKYPATLHLTDFIPGHYRPYARLLVPDMNMALPAEEATVPELLARTGYVSACFGKWHLGGRGSGPLDHGFDVAGGAPNRGDKFVHGLTQRAIDFMRENRDRPFFLLLSRHTVHIPLEAPETLVAKYQGKLRPGQAFPDQANPTYAAMVEALDQETARLLDHLDDLDLDDRTVVVFYSDNGGLKQRFDGQGGIVTSNAPLRDEKGSLYEGGIRVPLIIRWPGVIEPGRVSRAPVTSPDLLPTFLEIAGIGDATPASVDGVSLMPLLRGGDALNRDAIYWHYPHYHHTAPAGAVRRGSLKLIEYVESGRTELYDLDNDPGETNDLAAARPETAAALLSQLRRWRQSVNAQMPDPNPAYDERRAGEWHRRPRP